MAIHKIDNGHTVITFTYRGMKYQHQSKLAAIAVYRVDDGIDWNDKDWNMWDLYIDSFGKQIPKSSSPETEIFRDIRNNIIVYAG